MVRLKMAITLRMKMYESCKNKAGIVSSSILCIASLAFCMARSIQIGLYPSKLALSIF